MLTLQNYIQGQFQDPAEKKYIHKISPLDQKIIYQLPQSGAMDAVFAIQSARKAHTTWSELELSKRVTWLKKLHEFLLIKSSAIVEDEHLSQGMAADFLQKESFAAGMDFFSQFTEVRNIEVDSMMQSTGVISIILPWTLSFRYLLQKIAPALYFGNTVVVKSSQHSAVSVNWLAQAADSIGLPAGVMNVLHGSGEEIGSILTAHPAVAAVAFSGSLKVAEKFIQPAAQQFKKIQCFMGVKNSAIVLADFDFSLMPNLVRSCFEGSGQLAHNISRIFVPESIYDLFCEKIREEVLKIQNYSPLISVDRFEQAESYLKLAVEEGAKILVGKQVGEATDGTYFKPTILLNLPNCSELQQLDLQSPLVILTSVKYQHEAVKWVNTGYSGYLTQVWSGSEEKASKISQKLQQSCIFHNHWLESASHHLRIKGMRLSFYGLFRDEDFNAELKFLSVKKTN